MKFNIKINHNGEVKTISGESHTSQWDYICDEHKSKKEVSPNYIMFPVPNAISGEWDGEKKEFYLKKEREFVEGKNRKELIILLAESPNKDEYGEPMENNGIWSNPKYPLADQKTLGRINNQFARLFCNAIEKLKEIDGNLADNLYKKSRLVAFFNPIRYQASLYSIYNINEMKKATNGRGKKKFSHMMLSDVRNKVWREMFKDEDLFKDFEGRIYAANPVIIFVAITEVLKKTLIKKLISVIGQYNKKNKKTCAIVIINGHPAKWSNNTSVGEVCVPKK